MTSSNPIRKSMRMTPLGRVRLASAEDAPHIMELVNEAMSKIFRVHGTPQIVYCIENCVLSICQLDRDEMIVGFLSLRDYPPIPAVHPQAWEEYVWTKYKAIELNSRNTLFIHLLCWHSMYTREVIDSMLKSVFMHDPYVHHVAMIKPLVGHPMLMPGQSRAESSFRRVNTMEKGMSVDQLPPLLVADRKEVCPRLRIRRAVEEDNDDIVPLLEAHSTRLREQYGEYYISELVARHPESERVLLVCEHKEVAVGIMCLNTAINFEALEESYELSPFCGLRKLDAAPTQNNCPDPGLDASQVSMSSACGDLTFISDSIRRKERDKARVTWIFDEDEFRDFAEPPQYTSFPVSSPSQLDVLHLLEEDEDEEMEFDIVNIDTDLLRVPQLLSYDSLVQGPVETMKKMMEVTHKEDPDEPCKRKPKGSVSTTSICHKFPEPLRYSGTSNVFLIELFAMQEEYDERYCFDILEVAFELFPDRDYCMICLPSNNSSFPLLEHFTLVTPFSNRMRFINETLYVTHVNSVRGKLSVRRGEAYDMSSMFDVCEHAPMAQTLLDLFDSALASTSLECYVMLSESLPVGMIVLGPMEDGTTVRTQYDLEPEPRRPGTDGMVLTGVVSPVFEPHYRWFLRELLRHSKYSTLFWLSRPFAKGEDNPMKHLTSVAGHMTPVHPRRSVPNISGNKDLDKIYKDISVPFALWVLERPLTSLPKVYVNSSIVVVGASRTGLSFLETLLLGPTCQYLTFSNVTLVSQHGLPTVNECLKAAATCVPRDGRYSDRYLKSVPFYFYLDVMSAVMVGIDRKKKCILLKGGGVKFYDELILSCGHQFQHPDYLHGPLQLVKEVELGKPCERTLMNDPKYHPDRVPVASELPDNVFLVNSLYEANIILRKLMHMITESSKESTCHEALSETNPVIVYGDFIEAYSCMAALLELGIAADMINFVEPFPPDDPAKLRVNCFNDEKIDHRVQGSLEDLGIHVYRGYYLTGWQHNDRHVESINLMSQLYYTTQNCFALFYFGFKAIDVHAFNAINECGLVYDGGLVVDTAFETNDPSVYGAGPCVKYSRKLYATPHAHRHYCSEDVGEALAKLFLKKMDPFVMGSDEENDLMPRYSSTLLNYSYKDTHASHASIGSEAILAAYANKMPAGWNPVMKFESPIITSATLPGPLYYMKVRKPGLEIPMEVQLSLPHQGHTLTTDRDGNYFRLQLNVLHCVCAVTCLSHEPFSSEILSQLYGKHEAFFNKLLSRFEMGLVSDLFEFFLQPWLSAVYQETFSDLLRGINEQDVGTVYDLVYSKFKSFDDVVSMAEAQLTSISRLMCSESCAYGRQSLSQQLGTFRSVIDKFVARKSLHDVIATKKTEDIPSECGQSEAVRAEAAAFWKQMSGEAVVGAHLAGYLGKTSVINSHYAVPDPALIPKLDIS